MDQNLVTSHKRFYENTLSSIERKFNAPDDTCFVFVQHAFLPGLSFFDSVENRIAAIIPKSSSSKSNPDVVHQLRKRFPGKVHPDISRDTLLDPEYTVQFLKDVTRGRPFAILEYGAYFAPAAEAISNHTQLGSTLRGFVEGTENGIRGSDDQSTIGYQNVVARLQHPVVSKSRSCIKKIMDIEIGPAIVHATNEIFRRNIGCTLKHCRGTIGVVGLGAIGNGILEGLNKDFIRPLVFDTNLAIMATLANHNNNAVSQDHILRSSDILFLNTGSCFFSEKPALLKLLKDNATLILCTSGDVEAGIPQLIADGYLTLIQTESNREIATYKTMYAKKIRIILGIDGIGQAPNMSLKDGSASPANLMSDMEFCGIGNYLASPETKLRPGMIHHSPESVEQLILREWLSEFYPDTIKPSLNKTKHFSAGTLSQLPMEGQTTTTKPVATSSC